MVWVPGMGGIVWCGDPAGINIGSCVETVTDTGRGHQPAYTHWQDEEEDFGGHQKIKLSRLGHWSGATASFKYLRERK